MKNLLIVSGSLNRGGAERVISILANELVQRGWDITILTVLDSGCGYALDPRIRIINISRKKQNQILSIPRLVRNIRKTIVAVRPDSVVSFMIAINILTWFATRGLKVRFIPSERNDPSIGRNAVFRLLQRTVYKHSNAIVFQTERAKKHFSSDIQKKSVVIPNPVRVPISAQERKAKKIVSIGRLEPQKNQKLLIRAFNRIHSRYPGYCLEIYGEGALRNDLQQLIDSLELTSSVFLPNSL